MSSGARPGDDVIMTKSVGIEGTAILASDFSRKLWASCDAALVARAKTFGRMISVVNDASTAVLAGGVHAMHDPTEGGLLQGIWELAEASKIGFRIRETDIDILPETREICSVLNVDPLRLMSSGCLLIAAAKRKSAGIIRQLKRNGINGRVIGTFTSRRKGRRLVGRYGNETEVLASERDELYRVIERYGLK